MIRTTNSNRDMLSIDQLPAAPPKGAMSLPPRSITGLPSPNVPSARAILPPSSCSGRSRISRDGYGGATSCGSAGLTLSESIRQSGKAFEEQEQRLKQLSQLTQDQAEVIKSKDIEIQNLTATWNDRNSARQREIDQLRDKERASEITIRGLEEEIKLLRKQNNEIDKLWRCSDEKLRSTNEDFLRKGMREAEAANKYRSNADGDGQSLLAAESQVRTLKRQLQHSENEADSLRQQLSTLQAKIQEMEESKERLALERTRSLDDRLERKVREQEARVQTSIGELEKQLSRMHGEVKGLQGQLESANATREALDDALRQARDQTAAARAAEASEAARVKELQSQLDVVRAAAEVQRLAQERRAEAAEVARAGAERQAAELREQARVGQLERAQLEMQLAAARADGERLRAAAQEAEGQAAGAGRAAEARGQEAEEARRESSARELELAACRQELAACRAGLAARDQTDAEALGRLCRIRELEAALRAAQSRADAAEKARERQEVERQGGEKELGRLRGEVQAARRDAEERAAEAAGLRAQVEEAKAARAGAGLEAEQGKAALQAAGKLGRLVDLLKKRNDMLAQMHRLQMLLRMAEITKLEEYIKCSRRYDAVREEKLGLLTYNLASAESNAASEADEATRKRIAVREERMTALMKKQKTEEDKMKTNDESYISQTKRLKEKLDELEATYAALNKDITNAEMK